MIQEVGLIINTIRKSLLGGFEISIGCIAFLSVGGGTCGAFLFSIGLLLVCTKQHLLFTGKVCYISDIGIRDVLVILVCNMLAAAGVGLAVRYALPDLIPMASAMVDKKLAYSEVNTARRILMPVMCNVMIFFAVDEFDGRDVSKVIRLILCVMVFILCGFEHCIANGFYFSMTGKLLTKAGIGFMIINIILNGLAGIGIKVLCRGWGRAS